VIVLTLLVTIIFCVLVHAICGFLTWWLLVEDAICDPPLGAQMSGQRKTLLIACAPLTLVLALLGGILVLLVGARLHFKYRNTYYI